MVQSDTYFLAKQSCHALARLWYNHYHSIMTLFLSRLYVRFLPVGYGQLEKHPCSFFNKLREKIGNVP